MELDQPVALNTTAQDDYVGNIERRIWVIKERDREIRSVLPFRVITNRMVIELINFMVIWLNAFPPQGGFSDSTSPRTILTGMIIDNYKHCRAPFGAYLQTHEKTSNDKEKPRTIGAICLGPTGKLQGSYKCLNLLTGKNITRIEFNDDVKS